MNPLKQIKISLAIFILASVLLIGLLIYPLFKEIRKQSENLVSQKKTLIETKIKTQNLREFQIFARTYKENLKKTESLFIDAETPIEFIKFLEREASLENLSLGISPGTFQKIPGDPWPFMNFQLTLSGSFPNFLRFLEKLESGIYLIEVSGLNVRRLTEADLKSEKFKNFSTGDINATLSIKAYAKNY